MDKQVVNLSDYFTQPNPKLKTNLSRNVSGYDKVVRSPFYKSKSPSVVLRDWMKILSSNPSITDKYPEIFEFENDLSKKVGPLSFQAPLSERMDDVESYYEHVFPNARPIPESATQAVVHEWSKVRGILLRSQAKTVEVMKKSTSSGSPFVEKRRNVIADTIPCDINYPVGPRGDALQRLPKGNYLAAAILGWRGQEGGPTVKDVKQRSVWMFPFAVNVEELRFYQPLIESCQKFGLVPGWISNDAVDMRVTNLFKSKNPKDKIIVTDFTKFDQHFNRYCQQAAHDIFSHLLSPNDVSDYWLNEIFPIKYHIPLVIDEHTIIYGWHGMGSGSGGTNPDETTVHRALQHEAAMRRRKLLNLNSMCLGDDGIITYPGAEIDDVLEVYTSHGLEMNESKQTASTSSCIYLRRLYIESYKIDGINRGIYSTARALGKLMYMERYPDPRKWNEVTHILRWLSILENVRWHPLREQFVNYCIEGDKYRLGLSLPHFFDDLDRKVKEVTSEIPDFLGYNRTQMSNDVGINDWWVVKYLKSMR